MVKQIYLKVLKMDGQGFYKWIDDAHCTFVKAVKFQCFFFFLFFFIFIVIFILGRFLMKIAKSLSLRP
jgi:hypothetical protein